MNLSYVKYQSARAMQIILIIFVLSFSLFASEEAVVKIHYLGHSSFVMQFDNGVTVVMDYGHYNAWVDYGWDSPIHDIGDLVPDIMTYSHNHDDHYDPARIPTGVVHILTGMDSLEYKGITITPIRTCEDDINIESNTSYLFEYKDMRILHLADAQAQIINIRNQQVKDHILDIIPDSLDLMFMTIEGKTKFILQAEEFVHLLSPKRIIPIHHWSEAYLDDFLAELELQNLLGKNYQISRDDTSDYYLFASEQAIPVKAIALKRSPFSGFPVAPDSGDVVDYDGNVYHQVVIGEQIWLKENLKSTHYSDGTPIPDVVAYNNTESIADIFGRLYVWDAAMRDSTIEGAQGACPCGWHVPSDDEWKELEDYLGGADVAGGKMKESSLNYWLPPNTGADNSSSFTAVPAGEYDAYYNPHQFNLMHEYAVFWTSTEVSASKARERYLSYNDAKSSTYDWYKVMKYSIRCIKDKPTTSLQKKDAGTPNFFHLEQNYPNPFNPETTLKFTMPGGSQVNVTIYNILGQAICTLLDDDLSAGSYQIHWDGRDDMGRRMVSGVYLYRLKSKFGSEVRKMSLMR